MREIKFRAWDKKKKILLNRENANKYDTSSEYYSTYFGILCGLLEDIQEENRIVLMQYTGLKDKNGKEIYEGDIVRVKYNRLCYAEEYPKELREKFMNSGNFEVIYKEEDSLDGGFGGFYFRGDSSPHINYCKRGEVIGNIYENPEVLKD